MAYQFDYHRRSTRLQGYDYADAGAYYVTVCVEHRECLLGEIVDGIIFPSEWGKIAGEIWEQVADHWTTVDLDAFVIMPNHFHGIVIITESDAERKPTLGSIIAYWKYQSTKRINAERQTPGTRLWQRNYHDRVIRDEAMLAKAQAYIANNPSSWPKDVNNLANL